MNSNLGPDFINIGVPRAGTTWLAKCLSEHPDIFIPKQKDLFFFNTKQPIFPHRKNKTNWSKGLPWYKKQFENASPGQIKGEVGTRYFYQKEALEKIKKNFPNIKILLFLRNPVDRLISDYNKNKYAYSLPNLEEYLGVNPIFLETGMYSKYARDMLEVFPKENVLICKFDDISSTPNKTLETIYSFIGVKPDFKPKCMHTKVNTKNLKIIKSVAKRHNLRAPNIIKDTFKSLDKVVSKIIPEEPIDKKRLISIYQKDIENLEKITNLDLDSWKH